MHLAAHTQKDTAFFQETKDWPCPQLPKRTSQMAHVKELTYQYKRHKQHGFNPGLGISPGREHSNTLQYSCLDNPWTEKSGGLQLIGLQRKSRHDWKQLSTHTHPEFSSSTAAGTYGFQLQLLPPQKVLGSCHNSLYLLTSEYQDNCGQT